MPRTRMILATLSLLLSLAALTAAAPAGAAGSAFPRGFTWGVALAGF